MSKKSGSSGDGSASSSATTTSAPTSIPSQASKLKHEEFDDQSKSKQQIQFMQEIESATCLSSTAFPKNTVLDMPNANANNMAEKRQGKQHRIDDSQVRYETEIERLNLQLNEHKLKQMEMHKENEHVTHELATYKRMNQVIVYDQGGVKKSSPFFY